jgi:cystathionine gamma-synthase
LDTLKIQEKFGRGCVFFGHGNDAELLELETLVANENIAAVFCEFPSNPLLRSPPLQQLWELSQKFDFFLIVDETIGNFVNTHVLSYCDMIVSSLTKVFSGDSNVMGGSLVMNPNSKRYKILEHWIQERYQDCLWDQDAIFLERNSRKFQARIQKINHNAELLCDQLKLHSKGI